MRLRAAAVLSLITLAACGGSVDRVVTQPVKTQLVAVSHGSPTLAKVNKQDPGTQEFDAAVKKMAVYVWNSTIWWNTQALINWWTVEANKPKPQVTLVHQVHSHSSGHTSSGALIPASRPCVITAWKCLRESNMTINAQNAHSSASGKYQFMDDTWNNFGGYAHAKDAPEEVQDAKASSVGECNWNPPNYCAGG